MFSNKSIRRASQLRRRRLRDQRWEQRKDGVWQPVLLEEHVLREIVTRLWWAKIKVYRINCAVGGKVRPNEPGIPDLVGWIPAKWGESGWERDATPLFIEVKRPGGARRPAQIRFIEEAKSDGCVAFFAESWDDVVRNLKDAGVEIKYEVGGKT